MINILFVCLGNICRSPLAEGLFIHHVKQAGLEDQFNIDSCGTGGWHAGESADPRMLETAGKYGIHLPSRARQIKPGDLNMFDYIIPMDHSNMRDIKELQKQNGGKAQILLMRNFDDQGLGEDVPDPYYGGRQGFDHVYEILDRSTVSFLDWLKEEKGI
jgi:protein-tyrosine phosphatase